MAPSLENVRASRAFLLRTAELLHAHGTPAHRLERVLSKMAAVLGVQASFLVTPTAVVASFGKGSDEQTHLLRIESTAVNLGKLVELDQIMDRVGAGDLTVDGALEELERIAAAPPRYGKLLAGLAFAVASAGAAVLFGGGVPEVACSSGIGLCLFLLGWALSRTPASVGLFELLAAFSSASLALGVARFLVPLDYGLVTLAGVIVLVPGLTLTIALTELATRHLVSGVARLAGAAALFLTILLGVALAWRIGEKLFPEVTSTVATPLTMGWRWVAIFFTPVAFAIMLEVRRAEFLPVLITSLVGIIAARAGFSALGGDLGPFLGAFAVGLCSNLYARIVNRPSLVVQTPAILLLVPGSLGYLSLTSFLDRDALAGIEGAFRTGLVAISLVGGLLAANVVLPPRRVL